MTRLVRQARCRSVLPRPDSDTRFTSLASNVLAGLSLHRGKVDLRSEARPRAGVLAGSGGSTPVTGAEMGASQVGEVARGLGHPGKPDPLARGKRRSGQGQGPGLGRHGGGGSWGPAGRTGGGLGGVGPLLALKQPGKQHAALHFSCLTVENLQTRHLVLRTPAEEAAHRAPRGLLAGGRKTERTKCVPVLSLSLL